MQVGQGRAVVFTVVPLRHGHIDTNRTLPGSTARGSAQRAESLKNRAIGPARCQAETGRKSTVRREWIDLANATPSVRRCRVLGGSARPTRVVGRARRVLGPWSATRVEGMVESPGRTRPKPGRKK